MTTNNKVTFFEATKLIIASKNKESPLKNECVTGKSDYQDNLVINIIDIIIQHFLEYSLKYGQRCSILKGSRTVSAKDVSRYIKKNYGACLE